MKLGLEILHTIHITALILILNSYWKHLRNLEKCGQNLGVLQCKILTSDLSECETPHISQMKVFCKLIARFKWLLEALGGMKDMIFQSLRFCIEM